MSTSGGTGTSKLKFCVYCHAAVEKVKHRCEFCQEALCRVHREKVAKSGLFSGSAYHCSPPCSAKEKFLEGIKRGEPPQQQQQSPVQTGQVREGSGNGEWARQPSSASSASTDYGSQGGSSPYPTGKVVGNTNSQQQQQQQQQRESRKSSSKGGSSSASPVNTFSMTSPNNEAPHGRQSSRGGATTPGSAVVVPNSSFATPTNSSRSTKSRSPAPAGATSSSGGWVPFPQVPPVEPNSNKRTVRMPGGHQTPGSTVQLVSVDLDCPLTLYQRYNISSTGLCEMPVNDMGDMVRGVCLGSLPNGSLVWHQRGKDYPSIIPTERVPFVTSFKCAKCRHCGVAMPFDESTAHVASHKQSGAGTVVDDIVGIACGDVQLLLSLMRKRKLGEGAQGIVWLCERAPTANLTSQLQPGASSSQQSMTKFVSKDIICATKEEAQQRYQQSVRFMNLKHEHLIGYVAAQLRPDKTTVVVVMPYYAEKDLSYMIRNAKRFEEEYIMSIVLQIAGACKYIHGHSPPIIHGDIKSDNILLFNQQNQVLLMDLDTSVELVGGRREVMEASGTTEWASPETLHDGKSTSASDIWSVGLLIYVLAVLPDFPMIRTEGVEGCPGDEVLLNNREVWGKPLGKNTGTKTADLSISVQNAMMARGYSSEMSRLTAAMLNHDPSRRPTAAKVIDFVTDLMTKQLLAKAGVE